MFEKYDVVMTGGVDKAAVESAETKLGFKFSRNFVDYLFYYGTIELNNNELFGLGIDGYRNIVNATIKERTLSQNFPMNSCVIYNIGVDSVLILLGDDGCVYEYTPRSLKKIFDSFNQWIFEEFVTY